MKKSKIFCLIALLGASVLLGNAFFRPAGQRAAATSEPTLSDTYRTESSLVDPPTVVYDVTSASALRALEDTLSGERPASAILHVGGDGSVINTNGDAIAELGETVGKIRAKVIPILSVGTEQEAEAAKAYFTESGLIDTAVLSEDPDLVRSVRESCSRIRGIVRLSGKDAYDCVKTASLAGAGVVMLGRDEASYEKVTFIQSRFKAVWVVSNDEFDDYAAIASGAYGIVTEDFSGTYDAISSFSERTYARMPFNVAHRGLPTTHNENSVSGTRAAIEAGATHVELDGKLTTDGEIVMMHDDTIDRTADGKGNIESMSLDEVKSYFLDLHGKEEIPTLKEIIPLFDGTDAVLVFEVKTKNTALIARLKEILDETDFYEHIVVIAFDYPNLEEMRRLLPEVPTADLNSYSESTFSQKLHYIGEYNCAISTNGSSTALFNENYLRDRGIIGWYWTQENEAAVDAAFEKGLVGLTNNVGAYFGAKDDIYRVVLGKAGESSSLSVGDAAEISCVKYDGTRTDGTGEIVYLSEEDGYYDVIAKYVSGEMTYYTPVYRVEKPSSGAGDLGLIVGLSVGIPAGVLLLSAAAFLLIGKKRAK